MSIRSSLLFLLLLAAGGLFAQDTSLTRDFARLNAKERARIAKQEQEGAATDAHYQQVMAQAEKAFQDQRFEDALQLFKEARAVRPYNVYPKVKIQDLQALLDKRAAAEAELERNVGPGPERPTGIEAPPPPADTVPKAGTNALPETGGPAPVVAPEQKPIAVRTQREEIPVRPAPPSHAARPGDLPVDGVEERVLREGRAVVLERRVTTGGHTEVYRRVSHPWGDVVHFKDGQPIPVRVWTETFGD